MSLRAAENAGLRLAALTLLFALGACQNPPPPPDPRIADLEDRAAQLEGRITKLEYTQSELADRKASSYDLVVKWPRAAAPDHHSYADRSACEAARAVILMSNKAAADAAEAKVGTVNEAGVTVLFAGNPDLPTAICLPS